MVEPGTRVLVAMSGGVDSSVAAALLREQGAEVVGAFMRNGIRASRGGSRRQGCCGVEDSIDARRVADRLQIPFYAVDMEEAFQDLIADFVQSYAEGRTPNPCIECNRRFKMGALGRLARRLGARMVATGHFARIVERDGRLAVERGRDGGKDQSYVLYSLDREALEATALPLGDWTKAEVREFARRRGLPVAEKPESMEICFVPTGDYRDLLAERRPDLFAPGPIVDREGRVVGEHRGTALYTVGQRKGLPGGQGRPLFVTALDPAANTVRVGREEDLGRSSFVAGGAVFTGAEEGAPGETVEGAIQIRSRHAGTPARAEFLGGGRFRVTAEEPLAAVTPGQAAVLYAGGRILMGGVIERDPDSWV